MARQAHATEVTNPSLLIINQMAGPLTWEAAVDLAACRGPVALLTGHPDTLAKRPPAGLLVFAATKYVRGGNLRRFLCWVRFLWQAWWWAWRWSRDVPIVVFSNPPLAAWLAWSLHLLRGTPYAVVVHDIYPDVLVRRGVFAQQSWVVRFWRRVNRQALEHARLVLTLGDFMAEHIEQQFRSSRTAAGSVHVVSPWADCQKLQPRAKRDNWFARRHGQLDKLTVMYSGNMGLGHDLDSIIAAAESLQEEPTIHFMFVGAGPKWQLAQTASRASNVSTLPWQPESDLPYSLASADVAIVTLESELTGLAVPSKACYFLAAGVPVIALCSAACELGQLVLKHGCGARLDTRQPRQLATLLQRLHHDHDLLQRWKQAACHARTSISRSACGPRLIRELETYLPRRSRGAAAEQLTPHAGHARNLWMGTTFRG